jgi:non-homologous end joining protein Ku
VAIARTVFFRRVRSVLIRADGGGLIAHTLQFDYEIRSPDEAFDELPAGKVDDEMLDLAMHIIKTKAGRFEPKKFDGATPPQRLARGLEEHGHDARQRDRDGEGIECTHGRHISAVPRIGSI